MGKTFAGPTESHNQRIRNFDEKILESRRALGLPPQLATGQSRAVAKRELRGSRVPMPTALWGLDRSDQLRLALPVLMGARKAILAGEDPLQAIAVAGDCGIACEYARRALRLVLYRQNLLEWQEDPAVKQSDRRRAMDAAIRLCKRVDGKKGGWRVSVAEEQKHLKAAGL